jgi:hypothetical protein
VGAVRTRAGTSAVGISPRSGRAVDDGLHRAAHPGVDLRIQVRCLISPALAGIIYGLTQVGEYGGFGHVAVLVPIGAGLLLLLAFVLRKTAEPRP